MSQIKLVRTDSQLSQMSRASESMCVDDILVESWKGKAQQQFDLETILNLSQSQGFNETQTQIAETFYSVSPVKRHQSLRLDNPNNQYPERFSPGVNLFQSERGAKFFKYGDIDIENLFDYHPRARLYKRGFTDERINTILKDPFLLAESLQATSASSLLIKNQVEYQIVLDYLFYSYSVLADDCDRLIIEKCISDLLLNYGYSWNLNLNKIILVLTNYRADPKLLFNPKFYLEHFKKTPPSPAFRFPVLEQGPPLAPNAMLHTFKLIKNLILKNLLDCGTYDEFKMITWILFVTAHDKHLIGNRTSSTMVKDSLCALMKRIPPLTTDQIIDLGVLLTVRFRPVHLSVSSRNWRVDNVPNHLRLEGFNHPLNLLYSLNLIPPTQQGLKIRALMGFITVQLMLGVRNLVISNCVLLSRMWLLMSLNLDQWMGMQASHTTTRAFICMLDSVLYSVGTGMKPGSAKHHALRHLLELVDGFRKSLPEEESRTLDPIQLRKIVQEICNRWSFLVHGEDSVQLGGGQEILKKLSLED